MARAVRRGLTVIPAVSTALLLFFSNKNKKIHKTWIASQEVLL